MTTTTPRSLLNVERLAVPIALCISMVAASVWATNTIGTRISGIEHNLESLRIDFGRMAQSMERGMLETQARNWILTFRAANPTILVPDLPSK